MCKTDEKKDVNDVLIQLAKQGSSFALSQLWEINRGFIHSQVWKLCNANLEYMSAHGFTLEDMQNEMFFALSEAVQKYDADKGSFFSCLTWYMRKQINSALRGEHCRTIEAEDGRRIQVSGNPLNGAVTLDAPASGLEDDSNTRGDLIEDPAAEIGFREIEEDSSEEYLSEELRSAVNDLPDKQRAVIMLHRLESPSRSLAEVAGELGVSSSRAGQLDHQALKALSQNPRVKRLHDEIIGTGVYQHTGVGAWKEGRGSVEEYLVEKIERKMRRYAEQINLE